MSGAPLSRLSFATGSLKLTLFGGPRRLAISLCGLMRRRLMLPGPWQALRLLRDPQSSCQSSSRQAVPRLVKLFEPDIDDIGEIAAIAVVDLDIRADIDLAGDVVVAAPGARRSDAAELQRIILGAARLRLGAVAHLAEGARIDESRNVEVLYARWSLPATAAAHWRRWSSVLRVVGGRRRHRAEHRPLAIIGGVIGAATGERKQGGNRKGAENRASWTSWKWRPPSCLVNAAKMGQPRPRRALGSRNSASSPPRLERFNCSVPP